MIAARQDLPVGLLGWDHHYDEVELFIGADSSWHAAEFDTAEEAQAFVEGKREQAASHRGRWKSGTRFVGEVAELNLGRGAKFYIVDWSAGIHDAFQ